MSNSIEKVEQKLNSGVQAKEDLALSLAPHCNLIQQITPAPLTVAVLAELALLSTAHSDFKLQEPTGGFKRLKWTQFKPSLMQVSHEGWEAFNKAHSSMDEIRQATDRIPGDMKEVLKILLNMPDETVVALLPISLQSLEDVADSCLARSREVEEKFHSVRELIDELLQSGLSTESTNKGKKESLEFERSQKAKEEAFVKTQKEEFRKRCDKAEKEVEKRSQDYDKALDSVPSGWGLLGMKVVEGLSSVVSEGLSLVATRGMSGVSKVVGMMDKWDTTKTSPSGAQPMANPGTGQQEVPSLEDSYVYNNMKQHTQQIQHAFTTFFDNEGFNRDSKEASAAIALFKLAKKDLDCQGVSPNLKQKASFYKDMIELCEEVKKDCIGGGSNDAEKHRCKLGDMMTRAVELEALANAATATLGLNKTAPFMSKAAVGPATSNDDCASVLAVKMAQSKMEMTSAQLNQSQEQYNQASENLTKVNAKLAKTLSEIASLDAETATITEILDMLRKGLMLLGKLKDQWSQLTIFFEGMATLIRVNLHKRTDKFIKQSKQLGQLRLKGGMSAVNLSKDLIYTSARDATSVGFVVNKLASQYFEVSQQYLMGPMGRLSQLMVLDKDQDRAEIARLKGTIMEECGEAQGAIMRMVETEKRNFTASIQKRINVIESEFEAIVNNPAMTQDVRKAITMEAKKAVEDGRRNVPSSAPSPLFDEQEMADW